MYNTIIFDLDDTLTDDCENIRQAFKTVLEYKKEDYSDEKFETFYSIDKKTWRDRALGKLITPYEDDKEKKAEWLRASRFLKYFGDSIDYKEAVHINDIYMDGMKKKVIAREGTLDVIKYLYDKKYTLIIATNGPIVPLNSKLEKLQVKKYFNTIFFFFFLGFMKPHEEFYKGLLDKSGNPSKENILFIGDELEKDIKGGIENNIDTCWCNYNNESKSTTYVPKYEIHKLKELKEIL